MAYAALVSLAKTIQHILQHDHKSSASFNEIQQIKSLHKHLILLREFLEDFPEKLTNNFEGRIRDRTYKAEDVMEYFMSQHFRSHFISNPYYIYRSPLAGLHKDLELYSYDFKLLYQELQIVIEEIGMVAGEVMEIKNSLMRTRGDGDGDGDGDDVKLINDHSIASSSSRPVRPPTGNDAMVGFDDNLLKIKVRLCEESSTLQIIPIFGMGGIGKTTLAINAYDDPLIRERFDIRAWVTVSQDYSLKEIISSLLLSLDAFIKENTSKNESTSKEEKNEKLIVFKTLKGRRYLIVLDDMWSTTAWDDMRSIFPDDNNASRILLTTRLSDVAAYPTENSSSALHEMQLLGEDQSWDMLRQKVFKQEPCPPELENIGRTIASSCRGLPLAIVVIAGILSTVSLTRASWENVAKNATSAVTTNDEQFTKILSLSYVHLPHFLRPCFLYMGGFPEDYEIKVSKLIKLWVAEGFLKPSEFLICEEIGAEEYLEDLVKRSLVLVTKRKTNGRIRSCSLHDLVRDMCIKTAQEEKFFLNPKRLFAESIKHERRLSINRSRRAYVPYIYDATFRTILCFTTWHDMLSSLKDFSFLRVFDAVRLKFSKFPVEVLELFLLRYLAFSFFDNQCLYVPPSISKLQNLQSFFIFCTRRRVKVDLPAEIWRMTQLRHLICPRIDFLPYPRDRSDIFVLEYLQTLVAAMNFNCSTSILQSIPNLRKFGAIYGRNSWERSDFHLKNLVHLHQLEKLSIHSKGWPLVNPVSLWGEFCLPKTLKKLKLRGFCFSMQDMAVIGSLPNLEVLKLSSYSYDGRKWETTEEEFPKLKFLQIRSTNLEHWITESSHFPCLERLMLRDCRNLSEIPADIGEIPTLELIEVYILDRFLLKSAKQIQEEQKDFGNDFQVRVMR